MNNISFQGKTNLIFSKEQYQVAKKIAENAHRNKTIQARYTLKNVKSVSGDAFNDKINILLRNEEDGIFIRFTPYNVKTILDNLDKKVNLLKSKTQEKLTAWIIGGSTDDTTINALNKCADVLCDRPDIDTSILIGLKNPEENFVMRTFKDKTSIVFNRPEKTDVNDCFDIIELNNVDIK